MSKLPDIHHLTLPSRPANLFALTLALAFTWGIALPALAQAPPAVPPAEARLTESGLALQVLREGNGRFFPDRNDYVSIRYDGWRPNGERFMTTEGRFRPFQLDKVFPAWSEAIQQMLVGEKLRVWIPANLDPRGIPAIFDLEMEGVRQVANPPEIDLRRPPQDWQSLPGGVRTLLLEEGHGEETPGYESTVAVHFTGWTIDQKTFGSTAINGRPALFPLANTMAAFADCARLMRVGERRLCWVPEAQARGQWPENPQGNLTFEIQMLKILEMDTSQVPAKADG